ncbi:radical SAM family heme chaperone HemW [Variovorax sp. PAMC 28711]|uniref:radical SAM family heme chaperone HemW n=1 Tax=Variovorax sp. PAMC 28711 TaxID=1795631 RepID=UPI00078CAF5B|nr:radical SAM family heme chaperone HemW [Variovorax sp. PAMC 28711]AMM26797.1 YggW family oxidoreductase [Variovorax sp. PAMC 28711]
MVAAGASGADDYSTGATRANDVLHLIRPGPLQLAALPPLSLYVHLPWCLRKCPYCDFNSHEWRDAGGGDFPEQRYLDALIADLDAALPLVWGRQVHTIFIGGGTPSLFSPAAIDRLLGDLRARLKLAPDCEITLEANPGTFERDRFRAYRAAGVTRLSVGVQSFNDDHLKALGRVHDGAQAIAAVEEAASAFDTFNLDLMYALPGQTLAQLDADLTKALTLAPPHLSVYHLTIEPNTYFAKFPPAVPEDDDAYAMLDRLTERTAEQGFARYEVSAYAKDGHRCAHNLNYWQFGDYLGIGAGAHSKLSFAHRIVRQVRLRDPRRYMDGALAGAAVAKSDDVPIADLPFEFMLNALRLKDGFTLAQFGERTGLATTAIQRGLEEAEKKGLVARDLRHVWPTEHGLDFLNDLQTLFLPSP